MNRATPAVRSRAECRSRAGKHCYLHYGITRPGPWLGFVTSAGKLRERSLEATLIIVEFITKRRHMQDWIPCQHLRAVLLLFRR